MTTTINISLPKELYLKAKKLVSEGKYASISEIVRAGLRIIFNEADEIYIKSKIKKQSSKKVII